MHASPGRRKAAMFAAGARRVCRMRPTAAGAGRSAYTAAATAIAATALSGCEGVLPHSVYSALHAQGTSAAAIAQLWWVMALGSLLIWAGVLALFIWVVRPRQAPHTASARRWLVWGAGVLPAVVLIPLVAYALWVGEQTVRGQAFGETALTVRVQARQWDWRFEYPQLRPGVQYRQLILPAERPIRFELNSQDVIHSLWIPSLGGKLDAIPGHTNVLVLDALRPGRYGGQCAEFCGREHTAMRFEVLVEPAATFDARMGLPASGVAR